MGVVHLPVVRLEGNVSERSALRAGVAAPRRRPAELWLIEGRASLARAYCASCAAPIEFGGVSRGQETYCSIECSFGGDRPA